jgi:predicted transposase YbfD/YdcC
MVSAWAAGNKAVLGQVKTDAKSNEITAIPRLLELLDIHGCLVTIDAMGCQKDIAETIIDSKADYMLAVKGNQPTLEATVKGIFDEALVDPSFVDDSNYYKTEEKGHGRIEVRHCWTMNIDAESGAPFDEWQGLKGIVLVESHRTASGKTSVERRYYITSRDNFAAQDALGAARSHWGIENELHWNLDVAFREDDCRVRAGNAAENFAVIRHIAINLLKAFPGGPDGKKPGIKVKRLLAACNNECLLRVLGIHC